MKQKYKREQKVMDIQKVRQIRNELNRFTFSEVIKIDPGKLENYQFQAGENHPLTGEYCTRCEKCQNGLEKPNAESEKRDSGYRLKNISHGTHSLDFLKSMDIDVNSGGWSDAPVLFLMENPAAQIRPWNKPLFDDTHKDKKFPAQQWYWIHKNGRKAEETYYPKCFKQGEYGVLVAGLIRMFKLGNAYMTNLVKCGMNLPDGNGYLPTSDYNEGCITKCIENVLQKEIEILTGHKSKELLVFAFGIEVNHLINSYLRKTGIKFKICLLPHPANRMANDYRKYVLFGKVYKFLSANNVGTKEAMNGAIDEFLKNDNEYFDASIDLSDFKKRIEAELEDLKLNIEERGSHNKHKKGVLRYWIGKKTLPLGLGEEYKEISLYVYEKETRLGFGYDIADGFWHYNYNNKVHIAEQEFKAIVDSESETIKVYEWFKKYISTKLQ